MRNVIKAALVALVIALAVPVAAQDFDAGIEAGQRGDYAVALREFRPLATEGDAKAQFYLGYMYGKGQGVPQDYVLAHMWFNLAAIRRNGTAPKGREYVADRMTSAQIAEARKLAREWTPK